ncbi:FAD-dependent tricarballylate dehydrogenase TcuA [Acidovorax sp.]|uniref:FAD-dependent tricarballylate dehydrogenase TcuA n=1 Tax=Acidovorax sp. TaxID=1872122 RepID=UPI003BB016AF
MSADKNTPDTHDFDVVVIGCGIAGLSAAVSALEKGARVAILERSTVEDRGGQTRWTEAQMRMKSEHEVSDDFESHFAENAGHYLDPELISEAAGDYANWSSIVKTLNFTDPELISTITERAGPTLQWLKTFGVRFDFQPSYFITTCTTRISPVGGGLALVEALAAAAEKKGATFFYRTTARDLVTDDTGRVRGVLAVGERNRGLRFNAKAVVLGSGGFQGNPEMLTHYIGPKARYLRPVARGGYYNKGEGIRMAMSVGAAGSGDYGQIHAEPLDPRSGAPEPIVLVFNYGILVNKRGERFIDEAPSTVDATYENITRHILEEPEGIAWAVMDAGIGDVPNWKKSVRSDQAPVSAATLDELAQKIGVPAAALAHTVSDFNAACPADGKFDPLATDGLKTATGYAPPKSNWARPLAKGPFIAYPLICGNCFTFGGIKVNTRSEVVNADGEPIPGLYAAGEMIGLYYGTYTGATSVLRGAVFGRIAGEQAAP